MLSLVALALPRSAHAQRTPEEWAAMHTREALAEAGRARGAVPLLRLWSLRDWTDPAALVEQIHAVAAAPRATPLRRALALWLEANVRAQLGQIAHAQRIAQDLGFLTRWLVIGPFDNEGRAGFDRMMPPESERGRPIDPSRQFEGRERPVQWRPLPDISRLGYIALDAVVRPAENACAFAHTTVSAPRDEHAVLWLGAAGQVRVYFNGTEVYRDEAVRRPFPDRAGVRVHLRRGANRVLLKVCSDDQGLAFYARLARHDGAPLTGLVVDPDPSVAPEQVPSERAGVLAPGVLAPLGVLGELRAAASVSGTSAQALEDLARFLAITGSDNTASPEAPDLAERAARTEPTPARWLLVAELSTDRNRRLRALEEAERLAPRDAQVLAALGHERRLGPHPDEALALLDRAVEADDGLVLARIERALVYDTLQLYLAARRELEEASVRAPRAPALLRLRAAIAEHAQLADEAMALRRAYLRVRYDDLHAHEALARELRMRGDRAGVRLAAERMLAFWPERLAVYGTAAELFEAAGFGDLALGTLARAVEIAPDEPTLWRARGELAVRLGLRDEGRASMRRALALSPQDQTLRRHIEALEPPVPRPDEALAETSDVFLGRRSSGAARATGYKIRSLQDLTVRTVYPNGLSGTFRQAVFEIRTQEGAESSRTFPIYYEPDTQRFELRAARVYHADGTVDESASMQEVALTGGTAGMYFDRRAMMVTFPRLSPGDVVEVRWRVDDVAQRNAFADYFGDLEVLQGDYPRARVQYVLRAPPDRQFYWHVPEAAQLPTLRRSERVEGHVRVYDFLATDVPALPPEDNAPGWTERAAYIHVSTYRTWEDVGRWYWGLIRDQLQLDDRVRNVVRDITRGLRTPRERVRAIYNWVIRNTRYVALEFGIHGFLPYRVPQVCSRGFGDCKDKASTIIAMLREAGIDASIVLVRTRNNGAVDTSPASLAVFDHAIAYVHPTEGLPEGLFLDGTAQSHGMDELPSGDQGAMALVVNQRGEARLTTIPVQAAASNGFVSRSEVTLQANRRALVHVAQEFRGSHAGGMRQALEAEATRVERLERALSHDYPGVRVSNVRVNDYADVDRPAHLEYDMIVPELGSQQGDTVLLPLLSSRNLARTYASSSTRTCDVVLGAPRTEDQRVVFRLPPGATVLDVPADAHIESPFVRLEMTVERQGNVLVLHRVITMLVDRVPVGRYAQFREVLQRMDEAMARRATIRLPAAVANAPQAEPR